MSDIQFAARQNFGHPGTKGDASEESSSWKVRPTALTCHCTEPCSQIYR